MKERASKQALPLTGSLSASPAWARKKPRTRNSLPWSLQEAKYLHHHLLPTSVRLSRKTELRKQPGLETRPVTVKWHLDWRSNACLIMPKFQENITVHKQLENRSLLPLAINFVTRNCERPFWVEQKQTHTPADLLPRLNYLGVVQLG